MISYCCSLINTVAVCSGLRELDRRGVDLILVRGFVREGIGLAIWDRLLRAAEGRVIDVES